MQSGEPKGEPAEESGVSSTLGCSIPVVHKSDGVPLCGTWGREDEPRARPDQKWSAMLANTVGALLAHPVAQRLLDDVQLKGHIRDGAVLVDDQTRSISAEPPWVSTRRLVGTVPSLSPLA
jgi:hypothetical protein